LRATNSPTRRPNRKFILTAKKTVSSVSAYIASRYLFRLSNSSVRRDGKEGEVEQWVGC